MNSKKFEQRLRSYKEQKYKLLLTKQELAESDIDQLKKLELSLALDQTLELVDVAIATCTRIVTHMKGIESEIKGYQIIEQKLEEVMFDNRFDIASTRMTTNKLNQVGEHILQLEQLLKYKR